VWKQEGGRGEEGFEGHEMRARFPGEGIGRTRVLLAVVVVRWRYVLVREMPTLAPERAGRNMSVRRNGTRNHSNILSGTA
jgi:hypothetical protein